MDKKFPEIIAALRKSKGITQKKAAADLHISQALLSHYEKGIRECGLDFLIKLGEYYSVSCDYLLGRTEQENPSNSFDEGVDDLLKQLLEYSDKTSKIAASARELIQTNLK